MPGPSNNRKGKGKKAQSNKRKRPQKSRFKSGSNVLREESSEDDRHEGKKRGEKAGENDDDEELGTLDEQKEDSDDERLKASGDKTVLALLCQGHKIGGAYYDPVKMIIYVLEDTAESKHYDVAKLVLEQANADIAITSSRADENTIDILRDHMENVNGVFQVRPSKEFSPIRGRERLFSLDLLASLPKNPFDPSRPNQGSDGASISTDAYQFMRRKTRNEDPELKRWRASVRANNFTAPETSPLCLSAAGALLDHLARVRALSELDDDGVSGLEVRGIESIVLEHVMQINADALASLSIFEDESHASTHSKKTKEGLSLFGILNTTRTTLGRNLLRQWLLRPSLSLEVLGSRHDAVECLVRADNIVTADAMSGHLKGLKNIPRILRLMKGGKAGLNEWQGLVKFTFHAALLKEALTELNHAVGVEIFEQLMEVLDIAAFKDVGNSVHEIVDWEESQHAGRVSVRPNVDEELDNWKHVYSGIDGVLSRVAEQISETISEEYTSSLNVVYFPQLGFLVCVPMKDEWRTEQGIIVLEGWTFQFSSESHVYFKSEQMHDMDRHIGDLHSLIVDREIEIIQALLERIIVHHSAISLACDAAAELDVLLCFAAASRAYNYVRPTMTDDNVTHIRQGRHPLHELVVDTFVPNDVEMRGGMGADVTPVRSERGSEDEVEEVLPNGYSMLVLTGANACGKSVYLKQVAMICFMAQIGCFVPAESAILGIVDKMFTRVHTRESVSKVQSSFMIDLNQVSHALRNCTVRSLILLDEFGKGTLVEDGAALLYGVLCELLARGPECPRVLATTHFHALFRPELLSTRLPIAYLHMRVLVQARGTVFAAGDGGGTEEAEGGAPMLRPSDAITYLYQVAPGLSLNSHAAQCARMFGIPERIVRRAEYVTHLVKTNNTQQLLDEALSEDDIRELADAETIMRRFLAWDLDAVIAELEEGTAPPNIVRRKLAEVLGLEWDPELGKGVKKREEGDGREGGEDGSQSAHTDV